MPFRLALILPQRRSAHSQRPTVVKSALAPVLSCMLRHRTLSFVDSRNAKIEIWSGSESAGKTYISLYEFLFVIIQAPKAGRIIVGGKTLETVQTNQFTLLTDPAIFSELTKHLSYTPSVKSATVLDRAVHLYGVNNVQSETKVRGMTVALAYVDEATILTEGF